MRAIVIRVHGGPKVLKLEQRLAPELRATDILVEVHAILVNPPSTQRSISAAAARSVANVVK